MSTEIEAKIKVGDLQLMKQKLKLAGATFKQAEKHHDSYFIDKGDNISKLDRGLRLRQLSVAGRKSVFLTYKGPRQNTQFKSRQEFETGISDFAAMAAMLEALGFEKTLEFEKRRAVWLLNGCEICLDELPLLGSFVEVEGSDEAAISAVLTRLGLQSSQHISEGYSRLMQDMMKRTKIDNRVILFNESK